MKQILISQPSIEIVTVPDDFPTQNKLIEPMKVILVTEYDPNTRKPTLTCGQSNAIYMVPGKTSTDSNEDADEDADPVSFTGWIYIGNDFERIGEICTHTYWKAALKE